jgi:transcriptional regulator with XRE-family HTH domain
MSRHTGISVSTLSKVEHDRSTLTYDKLVRLSRCLDIRISEFFVDQSAIDHRTVTARRKRMIPILMQVRAESAGESRDLIRHSGEEFVYVLKGCVNVVTEFYDPVILDVGESIYIDGNMGHAYVTAGGCDEATVLALRSGADGAKAYHDMISPEPRNFAGVSL